MSILAQNWSSRVFRGRGVLRGVLAEGVGFQLSAWRQDHDRARDATRAGAA
jgi:hypothetical protein